MKQKTSLWIVTAITLLAAATLCLYPSFRTSAQTKQKLPAEKQSQNNASPKSATKRSGSKISDVDQKDIQKAMEEVQKSMQEFQEKDWPKVQLEIENAMKEIDMEKIQKEIAISMKEVDMEKIQAEVQKAMKQVDAEKICAEVKNAMKAIDMKAIDKQLAEVKKINTEQLGKEMAKVK